MPTWGEMLAGHMPPAQRDRIAAEERREAREWEARQVERQDRADVLARMSANYERNFEYTHGCSQAEWRDRLAQMAALREQRDGTAEYGSETRRAVLVDGRELAPVERSQPGIWQANPETELLKHARAVANDAFMLEEVRRFDQRRGSKGVISRATAETIQCLDCIEDGNVTVDEYLEIHHGDDPLPERLVPDHPPAADAVGRAARTPMISGEYRFWLEAEACTYARHHRPQAISQRHASVPKPTDAGDTGTYGR